jgi:hypothetical protein
MPFKLYYSIQGSLFKLIQSVIYTAILFDITTASNVSLCIKPMYLYHRNNANIVAANSNIFKPGHMLKIHE